MSEWHKIVMPGLIIYLERPFTKRAHRIAREVLELAVDTLVEDEEETIALAKGD